MGKGTKLRVKADFFLKSNRVRLKGKIRRLSASTFRIVPGGLKILVDGTEQGAVKVAWARKRYDIFTGKHVFVAVLEFTPVAWGAERTSLDGEKYARLGAITITLTNTPGGGYAKGTQEYYEIAATDSLCDEDGDVQIPAEIDLLAP